MRSHRWVRAYL